MTRHLTILLMLAAATQSRASAQDRAADDGLVGIQVTAATVKDRPGKLSRELAVVKLSGGALVANTADGTLIVKGVRDDALTTLLASPLTKSVAKQLPKDRLPIEKLRVSYDPQSKPTQEDLKKLGMTIVEDYAKGSFMVVKPDGAISAKFLTGIEESPKLTFTAPVMRVRVIDPPKNGDPPAQRQRAGGGITATPNDPRLADLWGIASVKAPTAWDCVTAGKVVVAVIDTGVDYTHEDLKDTMWTNPADPADGSDNDGNGLVDDVYGADFVNADGDPMDDHAHGTHCAGTVSGVGNNAIGVVGMNWNTPIMALKWIAADGFGSSVEAIKCIDYAVEHGATVLSNSWWHPDDPELKEAIIRARDAGVLFVAAAGNFSLDNDDPGNYYRYPSSYDVENIISVAALASDDSMAGFSSFGLTTVDLGAPGVGVLSSVPGNAYDFFSGTSMATPHVAGAAALLMNSPKHAGSTWQDVRDALLANVRPLASLSGKCVTGGALDVSFLGGSDCGSSPGGCCTVAASSAFGWDEFKTVSHNENISKVTFELAQESEVLIHCSSSGSSSSHVTFSTGTLNSPEENVMWTDSLRTITAPSSNASVSIVTDMSVRLPKGQHTIYWKVWIYGGDLLLDSGTMQIVAVAGGQTSATSGSATERTTRFGEKMRIGRAASK
jgi:subtilisin family serine protease